MLLGAIALGGCTVERIVEVPVSTTPDGGTGLRADASVTHDAPPLSGDDDDDDDDVSPPETSGPGAPRILLLSKNKPELGPDDTLVVSAVVTDPDGIDDVIGGVLLDEHGATYGSFATSAAEGSYEISLAFAELDAVQAVGEVMPMTTVSRALTARFFDASGETAEQELTIELGCVGDDWSLTYGLCGGRCVSFVWDGRCGGCEVGCGDDECYGPGVSVSGGTLPASVPYSCWSDYQVSAGQTCGEDCRRGECSAAQCTPEHDCTEVSCDTPHDGSDGYMICGCETAPR